jgi:hypothetical protein
MRIDVTDNDGQPIGSAEVFRDGRRTRIRLGDTKGDTYTYRAPRGVSMGDNIYQAASLAASAFAKDWWRERCPKCHSEDRAVRLMWTPYFRSQPEGPCPHDQWHTKEKS